MSIKQLTVFSLTFVLLLVCSVVLIGANHESQTRWEYATYLRGHDEYTSNSSVYFSGIQITYSRWRQSLGDDYSVGDWSVYTRKPGNDKVTVAKGDISSQDNRNRYLLFLDALRKTLGGPGEDNFTDINWTDFDTHVMNLLGSAGYEVAFRYADDDGFSVPKGLSYRTVFKRKIK